MHSYPFIKACGIWLLMAFLAVANGVFRDSILASLLGPELALPASGLSLAALVLLATYVAFPLIGRRTAGGYLLVGLQWVVMTLLFEGLFGHYVMGRSWAEILRVFDVTTGDLFLLVLLTTLLAPVLVARLKGQA